MQIGGIGPEPPPTPPPGGPAAFDAALAAQASTAPGGTRLKETDLSLVRHWLVEGGSLKQIGTAVSLWPASVQLAQARVAKQFGVTTTAGWAPVLKNWLSTGELSKQEVAGAILNLTTKPDAGPPAAWKALLAAMAKTGSSPAEIAELTWAARCSPLGLTATERQVMRLVCTGMDTGQVKAAMDRSLDNIKNLRRQIMDKFAGFESRQGQDIHTRIAAGASFLGVLPPNYDQRTIDVAQLHTQANTLGLPMTVQQAGFLLDGLRGEPLQVMEAKFGSDINLIAFKLCAQFELPGVWRAGDGLPDIIERALTLGLSAPGRAVAEQAEPIDPASAEAMPEGAERTLALARNRGMLITPVQANILHQLSTHRPLTEIGAEHGEGLAVTMKALGTILGVAVDWKSGRSVQAFVDKAVAEELIPNRPWPSPARAPAVYAALMQERFGFGPEKLALLNVLAAEPAGADPAMTLTRAAQATGVDRTQVSTMVVAMAVRLCRSLPDGTMDRVVGSLRNWQMERDFEEETPERVIQAACQTPLTTRQLDTLSSIVSASGARELSTYRGIYAVPVYQGLLAIEKLIGIPADYTEAETLLKPMLESDRARSILSRP